MVVLSHRLWQRRFGADPGVLGRRVTLDGKPHTVVGVAPEGFYFPNRETEAWVPLALEVDPARRGAHFLGVIGRLADGVGLPAAQTEISGIAQRLEAQYPKSNTGWGVNLLPLKDRVVEGIRPALLVLMVMVGVVLLIACANVANLLLARMATREREIAIRGALGAARGRLVRQLLTESLVLSLGGGALGLALGAVGTRVLVAMDTGGIPRASEIGLDWTVLGFTLALALVTGLLFGLLPALQASKSDLQTSLREGGRGQSAGGRTRLVRDESLGKEPNGEAYLCAYQTPLDVATVVAKTSGDPAALTGALRAAVHDVDPNLPVYRVRTLSAVVADSLSDQRFNASLFAIFAALALVLASVGVYGVISYSVSQRTSEMGLRLALGAERREVLSLVVRQGMARVAIGVALGLAGAVAAGRFLRSLVVGIPVRDPATFGVVALVLLVVAFLATWLPARRATRVDPVVALRSE